MRPAYRTSGHRAPSYTSASRKCTVWIAPTWNPTTSPIFLTASPHIFRQGPQAYSEQSMNRRRFLASASVTAGYSAASLGFAVSSSDGLAAGTGLDLLDAPQLKMQQNEPYPI